MPTPEPPPELMEVEPSPGVFAWFYDQLQTLAIGFMLGVVVSGHVAPAPPPTPVPSPIPSPSPPPDPTPKPAPVVHKGILQLLFVEAVDTTPDAAAIRTAAVGTDWRGLNVRWRSLVQGQNNIPWLDKYVKETPTLIISEFPEGSSYDVVPKTSPIVDISTPKTFDDVLKTVKRLRGDK